MENPSKVLVTRFGMEVVMAALTATVGALVVHGAREFGTGWGDAGPQPGYFPFYIGLFIVIASGAVFVEALLNREDRRRAFLTKEQGLRVVAFVGPIVAFVLLAVVLGLYVALVVYLTGTMVFQGRYRVIHAVAVGIGAAIACYAIFEIWFKVPLLKGPLEALLNL